MRTTTVMLVMLCISGLPAQTVTNITVTHPVAEQVLKGDYAPADFSASTIISDHQQILCELRWGLNPDSLKSYLQKLESFHTRHSYSDTVSTTSGIGAARRWVHGKFQQWSAENEGRLVPSYLQFDWLNGACGSAFGWRNVLAVLPGTAADDHQLVLIEAHLDSRCAGNCDIECAAPGMEDNGSGTALVMELARVMSRYTFKHTLVFMLTTAEEQGLVGAEAMATWCSTNGIAIKAVQNNDIVGGVLCGETSSAPSCAPQGGVDSLQVRLFSGGSTAQPHRGFARSINLFYQEKLQSQMAVPMAISIMGQEDRDGRGGDHIPFRQKGYRNLRFTSANENGNANVNDPLYTDHQHTSDDILGVDTDGDLVVDSFFVDFNYLQRNALINGMGATLLALGPDPPEFELLAEPTGLKVRITGGYNTAYRIGLRQSGAAPGFTAIYLSSETEFAIPGLLPTTVYYVSVAAVDGSGITSPFSSEIGRSNPVETLPGATDTMPFGIDCWGVGMDDASEPLRPAITLLPCVPNPSTGHSEFRIDVRTEIGRTEAYLVIDDAQGQALQRIQLQLHPGLNRVPYHHRYSAGVHTCSLIVNGRILGTERLVVVKE